jgi:hypothetical protein
LARFACKRKIIYGVDASRAERGVNGVCKFGKGNEKGRINNYYIFNEGRKNSFTQILKINLHIIE